MLKCFSRIACIVMLFAFFACNQNTTENGQKGLAAFSADSLSLHIRQLSSDDFMGRKPFTEGETKSIQYLQDQFKEIGLEPGNGDSYLQDVPMVSITTTASPTMQVQALKSKFDLKAPDDYVIWTDKTDTSISINNDELVYAGYGVVAPEYNWNDYAGLDVKGKIVLVKVNDPGFSLGDSTLFKGKEMTYYGRWTYKFEEAARQGAKGCLVIHNTEAASYPFSVPANNWNTSRLRLDNRGKQETLCDVVGWISEPTAIKLLAAAGHDSTELKKADVRGFKGYPLHCKVSTSLKAKVEYNKSHNVIGKITGSKHPDEYIIYTAHWDHLGIGKPVNGDSIYNGALDNASGSAGLLELGRAFKSDKPERTIILLAVTAEEQGLQGSAWYAQNPIYPLDKTLADINIDGLNWYGKTNDIIIVGQGQSELEDILKDESAKVNRVISYDVHPEAGHYYRSDHFNFAKVGVPAIFANPGVDVIGKGKDYGKKRDDDYTANRYHAPSDQFDSTWDLSGAIADLQLLYNIGLRLCSVDKFPGWKPSSEFKAIREKALQGK